MESFIFTVKNTWKQLRPGEGAGPLSSHAKICFDKNWNWGTSDIDFYFEKTREKPKLRRVSIDEFGANELELAPTDLHTQTHTHTHTHTHSHRVEYTPPVSMKSVIFQSFSVFLLFFSCIFQLINISIKHISLIPTLVCVCFILKSPLSTPHVSLLRNCYW